MVDDDPQMVVMPAANTADGAEAAVGAYCLIKWKLSDVPA
jgi:hypothetical protein